MTRPDSGITRADLVLFASLLSAIWLLFAGLVGVFGGHLVVLAGLAVVDAVGLVGAALVTERQFRDGTAEHLSRGESVVWLGLLTVVVVAGLVVLLTRAAQ